MPIKVTDHLGNVTVEHRGEVVAVRTVVRSRNHSDTLDYTDFWETSCTEALVYVGRVAKKSAYVHRKSLRALDPGQRAYYAAGDVLDPIDRFDWLDCTCLFRDRGQSVREPSVDAIRHPDVVIDLVGYLEAQAELDAELARRAQVAALAERAVKEEQERNRPVVGKRMVVASGRKVKKGLEGTVAYVKADGGVLLKADNEWQDRKAQGTWVDVRHLKARA